MCDGVNRVFLKCKKFIQSRIQMERHFAEDVFYSCFLNAFFFFSGLFVVVVVFNEDLSHMASSFLQLTQHLIMI